MSATTDYEGDRQRYIKALEIERDKLRETVQWIASQHNLFFAECSQAEEIIARCREALKPSQ